MRRLEERESVLLSWARSGAQQHGFVHSVDVKSGKTRSTSRAQWASEEGSSSSSCRRKASTAAFQKRSSPALQMAMRQTCGSPRRIV